MRGWICPQCHANPSRVVEVDSLARLVRLSGLWATIGTVEAMERDSLLTFDEKSTAMSMLAEIAKTGAEGIVSGVGVEAMEDSGIHTHSKYFFCYDAGSKKIMMGADNLRDLFGLMRAKGVSLDDDAVLCATMASGK